MGVDCVSCNHFGLFLGLSFLDGVLGVYAFASLMSSLISCLRGGVFIALQFWAFVHLSWVHVFGRGVDFSCVLLGNWGLGQPGLAAGVWSVLISCSMKHVILVFFILMFENFVALTLIWFLYYYYQYSICNYYCKLLIQASNALKVFYLKVQPCRYMV